VDFNRIQKSLGTRELCELLNVHVNTVYRWIDLGKIKPIKVQGRWKFPLDEIERLWREGSNCGSEAVAPTAAPLAATRLTAADEIEAIISGSVQ